MATRLVWITMLAMADRKGRVWASVPGLANRARVAVKDAEKAIHTFLSPDPHSRTPDFEGRRIEPIDGGWLLLNYLKYRDVRDQDDEREKTAERVRRYRERQRLSGVTNVTLGNGNAEAEVEAESEAKDQKRVGEPPDTSEVLITLPLREGGEFEVRQSLVAEVEPLCPAVDVPLTLKEMKLWLVGNPDRRKTRKGVRRFITNWLKSEQEKHGR